MGLGLHHIGVEVDDIDQVKARYLKYDPHGVVVEETRVSTMARLGFLIQNVIRLACRRAASA